MPLNRCARLATVLVALVSLLFMQLAVASYVCPASSATGAISAKVAAAAAAAAAAAMADSGLPCAGSMVPGGDDAQPNLCQAHCQAGHQTADKHEPPLPLSLGALPAGFAMPASLKRLSGAPLQEPHLLRTTAPPVAISHCCFRL